MAEEHPRSKAALVEEIEAQRAALVAALSALTERQWMEVDGESGWSIKDHLAHLAAWERGVAWLLRREPRYEGMGLSKEQFLEGSEEEINAAIVAGSRALPLAEVRAAWDTAHQELLAALDPLDDADLQRTYSYYQPDEPGGDSGAPIIGRIIGNTYEHYQEHLPWIQGVLARTGGASGV